MSLKKFFSVLAGIVLFSQYAFSGDVIVRPAEFAPMADSIAAYLKPLAAINVRVQVDSVERRGNTVFIHLSPSVSDYAFREKTVAGVYEIASRLMPSEYKSKNLVICANGSALQELVPAFYAQAGDAARSGKKTSRSRSGSVRAGEQLVENLSRPYTLTGGLQNRHIALWQSHGYYYEQKLQRWEWQRARILETVEDLYTQSYVLPFLVPMLENAGANVLLPRERDVQVHEVIVDNDAGYGNGYAEESGTYAWSTGGEEGFAHPRAFYLSGENPFRMGTYRRTDAVKAASLTRKDAPGISSACWLPEIPQAGEYAVYVSYKTEPGSAGDAVYTVRHRGGETAYKVNQQMAGGTWVYLGTFRFDRGRSDQGVYLSNATESGKGVITADAVKFGGGMGNIARSPQPGESEGNRKSSSAEPFTRETVESFAGPEVSGYPRFTEGSRYWLQWAGFADTVYTYSNNTNDYNDDYMSRGRWVNTLSGGSKKNPAYRGLKVPVDLSFAFHTDAGTFPDDSIVGTLAIYTRYSNGSDRYPTGESRMAGRELADLIQTQIVEDVRSGYEPNWSRRGLWDRSYAESRTPNVPAMLLELLSHQNFADMKYGLDPGFRFTVSRAVYKGMLKFLSLSGGQEYVVQPLPVKDFSAVLEKASDGRSRVRLDWTPVSDPLEPTAEAERYVVYTRVDDGGFDNGRVVEKPYAVLPVEPGRIYSYKVTALNEGGESFPSEILSVGLAGGSAANRKTVLIVNGFNRVSAPAFLESKDSTLAGFYDGLDHGVPYIRDISYIGSQHEFRREIPWMDDDAPGFGASYGDYEDKVIAGNTFDYPYVHGRSLIRKGYDFVSVSAGAVTSGRILMNDYPVVDMIMGKQATTPKGRGAKPSDYTVFPKALREAIAGYCAAGGNLLVSGAYIATDLWDAAYDPTPEGQEFAKNVLKYRWMTHYASHTGNVKSVGNPFGIKGEYSFHTRLNDRMYAVESPDGLVPEGPGAYTIFRYADNNISAGVAYRGDYRTVSLGFPIETLRSQQQLDDLLGEILRFFEE